MTDDPIDFSSIDPTADPARFDAVASSIARAALDARAARGAPAADIFTALASWTRPALLAASLLIAAAIPALWRLRAPAPPPVQRTVGSLGIPAAVNDLLRSPTTPSLTELAAALGDRDQ